MSDDKDGPGPGRTERAVAKAVNKAVLKVGAPAGPYAHVCAELAGASVARTFAAIRRLRAAVMKPGR